MIVIIIYHCFKKIITREKKVRLEEIIKMCLVQLNMCLLISRFNSISAIIKPAQEHKYNRKTIQIHKNRTLK
jgi:hypothetical protein